LRGFPKERRGGRSTWPCIALVGLALGILTACGSGSDEAEPPSTTQATQTDQQEDVTPATAGLTIDDPGPGEALQAFVDAAAGGNPEAVWLLLTPESQERLGPTFAQFTERFGSGFREGVGTFAGSPYGVVISRRDEEGWGVAAIAGNRVREGEPEFATYGAAFRLEGDRWLLELGAPIELTRLVDAPPGVLQVEMSADAVIEAGGLWLDGEPLLAHVEGRRGDFVVEAELPPDASGTSVVVAFARTADTANAGAFPLVPNPEDGGADTTDEVTA
jgi:hypothetical protein